MKQSRVLFPITLALILLVLGHFALAAQARDGKGNNLPTVDLSATAPNGTTITVCPSSCDYTTVNQALAAAVEGDTIVVFPGVYTETIELVPGVRLQGTPLLTVLNGNGAGPIVQATSSDIHSDTVMSGFVIRDGVAFQGAGIYVEGGASPTLASLLVQGNSGDDSNNSQGSGIYVTGSNSAPIIRLSNFYSNTAGYGAAIFVDGAPTQIIGCAFERNVAQNNGGAIVLSNTLASVQESFFMLNWAKESGGALYLSDGAPLVDNNFLAANLATSRGGAIALSDGDGQIQHNRIVSNTAMSPVGGGGGVAFLNDSGGALFNNLVIHNRALGNGAGVFLDKGEGIARNNTIAFNDGSGFYISGLDSSPLLENNLVISNTSGIHGPSSPHPQIPTPTIAYNDVWGNPDGNFVGENIENQQGENGNISADPLFVGGPLGYFYLWQEAAGQSGGDSLAVDAGSGSANDFSLDGRTTRSDDVPDQGAVDMGYHFLSISYLMDTIDPAAGGQLTFTNEFTGTLNFPPGVVNQEITITINLTHNIPISARQRILGQIFEINAFAPDGSPVTDFNKPVTTVISYPADGIATRLIDENSLRLAYFYQNQWVDLAGQVDPTRNVFTTHLEHLTVFAVYGESPELPVAISRFRRSNEGWRVVGDAMSYGTQAPVHRWQGGHPGGFAWAQDDVSGDTWFWNAPPAFRGDVSRAYSYTLNFNLYQRSGMVAQFDDSDVILKGGPLGSDTLVFNTLVNPRRIWTAYSIPLRQGVGWRHSISGRPATQAEIQTVLSDLESIYIRGEFENGLDEGGLDNVILGGQDLTGQMEPDDGLLLSFMDEIGYLLDFSPGSVSQTVTVTLGITQTPPPLSAVAHIRFIIGHALASQIYGAMMANASASILDDPIALAKPYTITMYYDDEDLNGADEDSLGIYYWDENDGWQELDSTPGTENNTSATTQEVGVFALMASYRVYLPLVIKQ